MARLTRLGLRNLCPIKGLSLNLNRSIILCTKCVVLVWNRDGDGFQNWKIGLRNKWIKENWEDIWRIKKLNEKNRKSNEQNRMYIWWKVISMPKKSEIDSIFAVKCESWFNFIRICINEFVKINVKENTNHSNIVRSLRLAAMQSKQFVQTANTHSISLWIQRL